VTTVRFHYWAGARAVAGVATEAWPAGTISEALAAAKDRRSDPGFDRVLGVCTFLVDGVVQHESDLAQALSESVDVEVLPPFAGGR
jgi:sulfur-carrier protein